jgi:hypothetical protein
MNAALNANENDEADSYRELLPENRRFAALSIEEFYARPKGRPRTIAAPQTSSAVFFCAEWAENDPRLDATDF